MTGFGTFARAFSRRDRWMVCWFVVGLAVLYWSQAASVDGLYTTRKAFEDAAALMGSNPAFVAMAGPARALDTTGGQVAWQATRVRGGHDRCDEHAPRRPAHARRGGVGSRRAPASRCGLATGPHDRGRRGRVGANLLAGVAVTGTLVVYGLDAAGALVLGGGLCWCGLAFGGVALVACQVTGSTRAAYGITGGAIGLAYGLRAIGDVTGGGLSWLSPIGWYQAMHAYSGNRWWPVLFLVAFTGLVTAVAYAAFDRRDFGAGLWPTRPGPQRAGRGLRSSLGLSWRMQRGAVVGWITGHAGGGHGLRDDRREREVAGG